MRRRVWMGAVVMGVVLALAMVGALRLQPSPARGLILDPDREVVVLLHGLGRTPLAMGSLAEELRTAGYQVARVGYRSLSEAPEAILRDVTEQINGCCIGVTPRVHFVGHSLGGLLIRAYLMDNTVPNLGRVVLIGSPNEGTELVDNLRGHWWFDWLGPTTLALGTDGFALELTAPDYPLGVIAGRIPLPNEAILPGEDDGLVAVESTKVAGMSDFALVEATHAGLRHDGEVADLAIRFLEYGSFDRPKTASPGR